MKAKIGRWGVSALAAVVLTVPAVAFATVLVPPTARSGSLTQVGPVSADNGFPTWYRDKNSAGATSRLEICLPVAPSLADPYCAPPVLPDPAAPMVYPTNYPDEMFYQMATAAIVQPGMDLLVEMNLEGAYATGPVIAGDEMVFGRIRIRDRKTGYTPGTTWRVTHPYGQDLLVADAKGQMNMTQDTGTTPGAFGGALGSRVGPFLKWDPATAPTAPVGYTGDPTINHTVVGSPYDTNFVKVEQENLTTKAYTTIAETNLFSVQGRYAINSGVDVARATYSLPTAPGAASIDVFASSEVNQSIQVSANLPLGFATTTLRGQDGQYVGRLPLTVPATTDPQLGLGATIDVVNAGDKPVATKHVKLTDLVTIASATYTLGAVGAVDPDNTLVVKAFSSDEVSAPAPVLTVTGFGVLPAGGTATAPASAAFSVIAPPPTITVTSDHGGSATIATTVAGAALDATIPIAAFTGPDTVSLGQPVVLDSAPSTGGPLTYAWSQLPGTGAPITPTLPTSLTTPTLTFTPTSVGTYVMQLIVTGPGSPGLVSVPVSRTITVTPAAAVLTASAGPDVTIQRGKVVTLDASATLGAASLAWTQSGVPTVLLSSTTATKPTFTYPLMPVPSAAVGNLNTGYVRNNSALTFTLTATGVAGSLPATATDTAVVSPSVESFTGVTARYRTGRGEWRVTGTSSILAGQRVVIVLGPLATGRTIGTASVDAVGAFSVRAGSAPDPRVPGPDFTQVTVVSATGGIGTFGLTITP
jgi:hypothetical protein